MPVSQFYVQESPPFSREALQLHLKRNCVPSNGSTLGAIHLEGAPPTHNSHANVQRFVEQQSHALDLRILPTSAPRLLPHPWYAHRFPGCQTGVRYRNRGQPSTTIVNHRTTNI